MATSETVSWLQIDMPRMYENVILSESVNALNTRRCSITASIFSIACGYITHEPPTLIIYSAA